MQNGALNYYSREDYLNLDVQGGTIATAAGTRVIGVNQDFLRGFLKAIEFECGQAMPQIVRKCGVKFGSRLGQRFETELFNFSSTSTRDRAMIEFDYLLKEMWSRHGMGQLDVDWTCGQYGFMPMALDGSPTKDLGPKGHEGDFLFAGILEGFFSYFTDEAMFCVQTGDERLGSKDGTTFIVAPMEIAEKAETMAAEEIRHRDIVQKLSS